MNFLRFLISRNWEPFKREGVIPSLIVPGIIAMMWVFTFYEGMDNWIMVAITIFLSLFICGLCLVAIIWETYLTRMEYQNLQSNDAFEV